MDRIWTARRGDGPIVATAIHDGHDVRKGVAGHFALSGPERRREEDPFTGLLTRAAPNSIVVHRSRFEVDLNRPRDQAIYLQPEQAWGMHVWRSPLPQSLLEQSLADYDSFYRMMFELLNDLRAEYGGFIVLDIHSYNHRRRGPDAPAAPAEENPEINVGTGTMNRRRWRPVVERFIDDLRSFERAGRSLDVRENVRFRGGYFPRWIHETFPESGCALAIEVKKFFMDEWTSEPDHAQLEFVRDALDSTMPGLLEELQACRTR
ncbi:MAG: N-formylglutamate amidohydrolase [Planctomycetes bacterium]|nr:N-formylglutamate amidohydrolase [Planctomycetota bacterium]